MDILRGRKRVPKCNDLTEPPGRGKLGRFWHNCKTRRKCGRPPYDRLLTNPVLRADYHTNLALRKDNCEL